MEDILTKKREAHETLKIETKKPAKLLKEADKNIKKPFVPNKGYETLSEALNDLRIRGYVYDFNLDSDCLFCAENKTKLKPEDFKIAEYYRFEGSSDPSDNSIVYAINSDKYDIKGVLVNAYGIYTENTTDELLAKFKVD